MDPVDQESMPETTADTITREATLLRGEAQIHARRGPFGFAARLGAACAWVAVYVRAGRASGSL